MARLIRTTFNIVTYESAEQGDFAESGWIDEEGESMELDEFDEFDDEEETPVTKAIKWLDDKGFLEPSSSCYYPSIWYTISDWNTNMQTGTQESRSYHLHGFTAIEERAIFDAVTSK